MILTAIAFPAAGLAAWTHYEFLGRVVVPGTGFTVWRAWYAAVLLAALVDVLRARDSELRGVWAVLALSYLASFMSWDLSSRPLEDNALRMLAVMGGLLIVSIRPATAMVVILHGAVIICAYLTTRGLIPAPAARPRAFLAWSFPDISAGLQHASLMVLGGSAMAGHRVLEWGDRVRSLAGRGRLAGHAATRKRGVA